MYKIVLTKRAIKDLTNIDSEMKDRIEKKVREYIQDPFTLEIGNFSDEETLNCLSPFCYISMIHKNTLNFTRYFKGIDQLHRT